MEKCKDCMMALGCWVCARKQPNDVLRGPCGKAFGLATPNDFFWAAPFLDWLNVRGTEERPANIEWCDSRYCKAMEGQIVQILEPCVIAHKADDGLSE